MKKKIEIKIVIEKTDLGRIPVASRPSQFFRPRKGQGSYRRVKGEKAWQK